MSLTKSYIQLHFIVLLWGFTAILGLLIKIPFGELVFFRTLIAFIALYIILKFVGISINTDRTSIIQMLLVGVIISIHWMLFFGAARVSNASVSLIGMATSSLWTALLEPIIYKKRISKLEVSLGLVIIIGLYIIYGDGFEYGLGLILSLFSAMLVALFSVINVSFARKHNAMKVTFFEMTGAFLGSTIFILMRPFFDGSVNFHLSIPSLTDWIYLGILSLVCTVFAISVAINLLRKMSAFASNLVITIEPIYGILLALLFFGESEKMEVSFYVGSGIILFAVFLYPVFTKRFKTNRNKVNAAV